MCRWQVKRLGHVDYRQAGAILEDQVGKPREAMIGIPRWSSHHGGTPGDIAALLSRRHLAGAAVIRR
jgi:hypothetical protein